MSQLDVVVTRQGAARRPAPRGAAGPWPRILEESPTIALRFMCYLIGLACLSLAGLASVSLGAVLQGAPLQRYVAALMVACLTMGLACFYLAGRATPPRWLRRLWPHRHRLLRTTLATTLCAAAVSIGALAALPLTVLQPHHYANDAVAATDCATHLFLQGRNPYAAFNLGDCFARHGLDGRYTTPLQAGSFAHIRLYPTPANLLHAFARMQAGHVRHPTMFESFFNYPAGAFLLPAPFAALGWTDLSTFNLLWAILAYGVLLRLAPHDWRPWLLVMACANTALWTNLLGGQSNVLDGFLILMGWVTWRRSWPSALLMGVAVATRQDAWLFAPFYLILTGQLFSWRVAGLRLAIIGGVFYLINAPFFVVSPDSWLHGVLGPMTDPMFPLGGGIIALATSGASPLWPRPVYLGLQLAALAACLILYARTCRGQPWTGPALAMIPVLFAWRSLFSYFYVALPLLCLWAFVEIVSASYNKRRVAQDPAPTWATAPVGLLQIDAAYVATRRIPSVVPRAAPWAKAADHASRQRTQNMPLRFSALPPVVGPRLIVGGLIAILMAACIGQSGSRWFGPIGPAPPAPTSSISWPGGQELAALTRPASRLDHVDLTGASAGDKVLVTSLQGIANRPKIVGARKRDLQVKGSPLPCLRLHRQLAAVRARDAPRQIQPQAKPLRVRSAREAVEEPRQPLGRDAGSTVLHGHPGHLSAAARLHAQPDGHRRVGWRVLESVDQEIVECLSEPHRIGP